MFGTHPFQYKGTELFYFHFHFLHRQLLSENKNLTSHHIILTQGRQFDDLSFKAYLTPERN